MDATKKVNLTPGVYRLYAKVKTVSGSGKLTVKDYGGPLVLSTNIPNQANWADVKVDFTMPAAGQATLFLEISGAGQLYADNFVLVRLGDSNILVNADFENGANRSPWEGHGNTSTSAAYQNSYGYDLPSDWMQQKVNLSPGLYTLYAKVKTVNGSGKLTVKDYGGTPISTNIPNQANWADVQVVFLMPTSGQATMFLEIAGAGHFYADNFVLVPTGSGPGSINNPLLSSLQPKAYPYLVDPTEYQDYTRRPYPAITWNSVGNTTLLTAGRNSVGDTPNANSGKVFRPDLTWFYKLTHGQIPGQTLDSVLNKMKQNNEVIHNIGGNGPGTPFGLQYGNTAGYGQYYIPASDLQKIIDSGVVFTGFDIGEQDGRYNFDYKTYHQRFINDKVQQYLQTQPYFDRVAETQLEYGSLLSVLWYWHAPIKEGYTMLAGAETQNKITNGQVQYSFLRGAGKQYGVLWYGDTSLFDTWGVKGEWGSWPDGPSLGLLKRSYLSQLMYNSTILSFEGGWRYTQGDNQGNLTPIGQIHEDTQRFINENGNPGVMHTPVALLNDFYSGWMPAKQIANKFVSWNGIPYSAGDWLFDAALSMVYPNYEESAYFYDETGAMTNTPYGEIADSLLSDANLATLKQYGVVVAAGDLFSYTDDLKDKLNAYVAGGGNLIVTGENAKRFWPEWGLATKTTVPAGSSVVFTNVSGQQSSITEPLDYEIYNVSMGSLPSGSRVAATYNGTPVVLEIPMGSGTVTLDLTPFGLHKNAASFTDHSLSTYNVDLGRPYSLTAHTKAILDERFKSQQLFTVGDNLGYITNRKSPGEYTVAIYNNSLSSQPFQIQSKIGTITSITELPTIDLTSNPFWGPHPNKGVQVVGGPNDASHIYAGDIRLFRVTVNESNLQVLSKVNQPSRPDNHYVTVDRFSQLKNNARTMPTFSEYFDGVKVDWNEIYRMDPSALKDTNVWRNRHEISTIVDFTSAVSSGEISLDKNSASYAQGVQKYHNVLDKMAEIYGGKNIIIPLGSVYTGLADLCDYANSKGIRVNITAANASTAVSVINSLGKINLVYALTTGASVNLASEISTAGAKLGVVLIKPQSGTVNFTALSGVNVPQILDGYYLGWNAMYHDAKTVWASSTGTLAAETTPASCGY